MSKFWTPQLVLNSLVAGLGVLQYGYHLAELNAPEEALSCRVLDNTPGNQTLSWFEKSGFKQCIPLSNQEIGLVTSQFPIGGLVGSGIASFISDTYGRKTASLVTAILFAAGSFLETTANYKLQLGLGRFISGLAAGSTLVNSPLMLNEIAFNEVKGFLGTLNQVFGNVGILFTQALGIVWANPHQWRYILLMGLIIAVLHVFVSFFAIESPKWLVKSNQKKKAKRHLTHLRHGEAFSESEIDSEINQWVDEISSTNSANSGSSNERSGLLSGGAGNANRRDYSRNQDDVENANVPDQEESGGVENNTTTLWDYLTKKEYRNSRLVASIILSAQQLSGIPAIMFYGVTVIAALVPQYSILINCVISLLNLFFTLGSGLLIDRVGRKALLLISTSVMGVSTFLMSLGIINNLSVLTVIAVFTFISSFAIGMGPIPFLFVAEVTQLNATTVAQSYGTAMNWTVTVVIGYMFPVLNDLIGGYVFMIFAACCAIFGTLIWKLFPETKGKRSYNEVWGIGEEDR